MSVSSWIRAARLRTLPLAAASTLCGCVLAGLQNRADLPSALLLIATALSLQIFSNLANDYGDAQNGADSDGRQGPPRMVASGQIRTEDMQKGLKISAAVCCLLGLMLLAATLPDIARHHWQSWLLWPLLGAAALWAAYRYTAGRRPYGYAGLGDAAVFVFFGWLAVLGGEYLLTGRLNPASWLPANAMGLWCVMVLNLNNMRDIDSDRAAGKLTVAARLGLRRAKIYHVTLAVTAALVWHAWLMLHSNGIRGLFLHVFMLSATLVHLYLLKNTPSSAALDKLLPQWSRTVFVWSLVLALTL